jgi:hypothetical protein
LEEEIILEALSKALNEPLDPETKAEIHLKLSEKYMKDAEEFLTKKRLHPSIRKSLGCYNSDRQSSSRKRRKRA